MLGEGVGHGTPGETAVLCADDGAVVADRNPCRLKNAHCPEGISLGDRVLPGPRLFIVPGKTEKEGNSYTKKQDLLFHGNPPLLINQGRHAWTTQIIGIFPYAPRLSLPAW
jgi:hypothetical protein